MKRKGFTLIELLVVIAIIGLLSTLSVVSLNSARGKARDAAKKSDMNAIATAMELYNVEIGYYPLSAVACADNIIALTAAGNNIICSTHSISAGSETILQSIPSSPDDTDYIGFTEITAGAATSFCISAELEDGTYFKCVNGSCFADDNACTNNAG
jgi:type II secretion system protein G